MTPPPRRPSPYAVLTVAVAVVLVLWFVYSTAEVLLLLFLALLLSLYLGAITDFLCRRWRWPRPLGLLAAVLFSLAAAAGLAAVVIPPVLAQFEGLLRTLPALMDRWEAQLLGLVRRYPLLGDVLPQPTPGHGVFEGLLGRLGTWLGGLFPYVFSGLHLVIDLVSVLVMSIYLAARPRLYREGLVALIPPLHRELARDILAELGATLRSWIVGLLLSMLFLGVCTWLGLVLLRVPYALAFGVFTGVAVVVPFFGTIVSTALPAIFVLGTGDLVRGLLVLLLGVVVHLIEANVIHPLVMERQVRVPPVLSILSVLVMAKLLGAIGLLVALPITASVIVLLRRIYVQRLLEGRGFRRRRRPEPLVVPVPAGLLTQPLPDDGASVPARLEAAR